MFRGYSNRLICLLVFVFLFSSAALASGHGDAKVEKKGILLVAFGSSVPEAQVSFENIDRLTRKAYPGVEIHWAFTSHIIRTILAEQGQETDSPLSALAAMADQGFTHVAVQSLHTIPGEEYEKLAEIVSRFRGMPDGISHIEIGRPLLSTSADLVQAVDTMTKLFPNKRKADEAVVLMGHGTHHPGDVYYSALQHVFSTKDPNVFVGTVEGSPTLDDVLVQLTNHKIKKVWLMPFMSVAGDHARNDMAGDESDSWKSILVAKGFEVESILRGTAEFNSVASLWIDHLADAWDSLK